MLVSVHEGVRLEPDRNSESASRPGGGDPRSPAGIEDDDARLRSVLGPHELLRSEPPAVLRPEKRPRLDPSDVCQLFAVENEAAVLRTAHPQFLGCLDGGPEPVRQPRPDPAHAELRVVPECASVTVRNMAVIVILVIVVLALLLAGSLVGLAFSLFWLALTGLVVGALGRLVLPGRQNISLVATALVGIGASLLGGILANIFDVGWLVQFLVAVGVAAIGITLFASSEQRRRPV
jgi:uncharacterized membrane protein YeaQ/YmgE (transglycosylase-associated protein family)